MNRQAKGKSKKTKRPRFAVLASGYGSNLQAIIHACRKKKIRADLALVVSDKKQAFALARARKAKITTLYLNPRLFSTPEDFDRALLSALRKEKIDFIVLAGYMRILSKNFVRTYKNRILNIHPALLPAFKGAQAIKDAFVYGVKQTGVTIHFVDEQVDHGPIIVQDQVAVKDTDTFNRLEGRIHRLEHRLYPKVIDLLARGKLRIKGRKVSLKR